MTLVEQLEYSWSPGGNVYISCCYTTGICNMFNFVVDSVTLSFLKYTKAYRKYTKNNILFVVVVDVSCLLQTDVLYDRM